MVSRKHRFHGYGSLRFAYQKGQTKRNTYCALKYLINKKRQTYRVAVVVSKKVNKSSVTRNRIRRRVYEIVRVNEEQIKEPYDLVITVFGDQVATMGSTELQKSVKALLTQAKILKNTV